MTPAAATGLGLRLLSVVAATLLAGVLGGPGLALAVLPAVLLGAALALGWFPGEGAVAGWRRRRAPRRAGTGRVARIDPTLAPTRARARVVLLAGVAARRGPPALGA